VRKFKEGLVVTVTLVGKGLTGSSTTSGRLVMTNGSIAKKNGRCRMPRRSKRWRVRRELVCQRPSRPVGRHGSSGYGHHEESRGHIEAHRGDAGRTGTIDGGFGILQAIAPTRDEEDRSKKRATSRTRSNSYRRCWRMRSIHQAERSARGQGRDGSDSRPVLRHARCMEKAYATPRRMSSGCRSNYLNPTNL